MARLQQTQRKRVGSVPRLPDDVVAAIAAEAPRRAPANIFVGISRLDPSSTFIEKELKLHYKKNVHRHRFLADVYAIWQPMLMSVMSILDIGHSPMSLLA
ncbi:hypothetical protein AgCh_033816 [Apium graveolens]